MTDYRIQFLRDASFHPVGCVAISVNRLRGELQYQYSVLNPSDDFNRKLARQLALGRLVENPIKLPLSRDANMHEISTVVMTDLEHSDNAPSRAVKAAKLWLNDHYGPMMNAVNHLPIIDDSYSDLLD